MFYGVITDVISLDVPKGRYVVAVSGGVDSIAMLDMLCKLPEREFIVAHVHHGIRDDAVEDQNLVRRVAMSHNLVFETIELNLGAGASEALARARRYDFLRHVQEKYVAQAVITAHHRDDLIETAIINMMRGTGWRGLSSLRSRPGLLRPLLHVPKCELVEHARLQELAWREDSTNRDESYARNFVRHSIVPQLSSSTLEKLYQNIVRQNELTEYIEDEIAMWLDKHALSHSPVTALPRYQFSMLPGNVAHELLQEVLRRKTGKSVPRPLADQALLFCKVAKPHKIFVIDQSWQLRARMDQVIVEQRPTVVS